MEHQIVADRRDPHSGTRVSAPSVLPGAKPCRRANSLRPRNEKWGPPRGGPRGVCDYISGMTDKYAVEKFAQLFMPMSWSVK